MAVYHLCVGRVPDREGLMRHLAAVVARLSNLQLASLMTSESPIAVAPKPARHSSTIQVYCSFNQTLRLAKNRA